MCIKAIYINVKRSNFPKSDDNNSTVVESSLNLSVDYMQGDSNENCKYIHETPFAFCGESNLDDCRNCRRPSCTVIQCGYEASSENLEKFVRNLLID